MLIKKSFEGHENFCHYFAKKNDEHFWTAPQEKSHPPVVIIRAYVGRTQEMQTAFVSAVAGAVGKGLSILFTQKCLDSLSRNTV